MPERNREPYAAPNEAGRFGEYGGRFVAETLMHALEELTGLYESVSQDPGFKAALAQELASYGGGTNNGA